MDERGMDRRKEVENYGKLIWLSERLPYKRTRLQVKKKRYKKTEKTAQNPRKIGERETPLIKRTTREQSVVGFSPNPNSQQGKNKYRREPKLKKVK